MAAFISSTARLRGAGALRFLARIVVHLSLARSRRALQQLDDRLLRDVGVTRAEAEAEASRPFWDAPPHWRV